MHRTTPSAFPATSATRSDADGGGGRRRAHGLVRASGRENARAASCPGAFQTLRRYEIQQAYQGHLVLRPHLDERVFSSLTSCEELTPQTTQAGSGWWHHRRRRHTGWRLGRRSTRATTSMTRARCASSVCPRRAGTTRRTPASCGATRAVNRRRIAAPAAPACDGASAPSSRTKAAPGHADCGDRRYLHAGGVLRRRAPLAGDGGLPGSAGRVQRRRRQLLPRRGLLDGASAEWTRKRNNGLLAAGSSGRPGRLAGGRAHSHLRLRGGTGGQTVRQRAPRADGPHGFPPGAVTPTDPAWHQNFDSRGPPRLPSPTPISRWPG